MLNFRKRNLNQVNLSQWDLSNSCLWGVCAKEADFSKAQMIGADCRIGNFSNARFTQANCKQVNFLGAYLHQSDFRGANLTDAKFSNPSIFSSVFDANTCFDGAVYNHLGEESYWLNDLLEANKTQQQFFLKIKNHYFKTA